MTYNWADGTFVEGGEGSWDWSNDGFIFGNNRGTFGDFNYTQTIKAVTITGYTGAGGNVTIPAQINGKPVTSFWDSTFNSNTSLTSVTFQGTIASSSLNNAFYGDLRTKYLAASGGIGTYTTTAPVSSSSVWTKQ